MVNVKAGNQSVKSKPVSNIIGYVWMYVCICVFAYMLDAKGTGYFMSSCNPATYLLGVYLISPDYHSVCGGEKSIYAPST